MVGTGAPAAQRNRRRTLLAFPFVHLYGSSDILSYWQRVSAAACLRHVPCSAVLLATGRGRVERNVGGTVYTM